MVEKAVIPAAGEGSRLKPITDALPKEMIRVGKKPVIDHILTLLQKGDVKRTVLVIGNNKGEIPEYVGDGTKWDMDICYKIQPEPKGTADAIKKAKSCIEDDEEFFVCYGDNYIKPYQVINDIKNKHKERDGAATLVLHPVDDPTRFGIVDLDEENKVQGMIEKPTMEEAKPFKRDGHWLNIAGLMILSNEVFDYIEEIELGKDNELWLTDAIEEMRRDGKDIYGHIFKGERYDIGTYDSLIKADRKEYNNKK